jgi:ornithine decarboxylase
MNQPAVNSVPASFSDTSRALIDEDIRQQVSFSSAEAAGYSEPLLVMSEQRLRNNVRRFMQAMPRVRPHYAVKANSNPAILEIFRQEGTCFEIASSAELDALLALGVPAEEVFYSNPIKSPTAVKYAAAKGVRWYSVDSTEELEKIAAIAPQAKLYIRIEVSNEGSSWPLAGKFGASRTGIAAIIATALQYQLNLCGVTFHVGSQCTNINNWLEGIRSAKTIFEQMIAKGFTPELLNLGGGYPVQLTPADPTIEDIAAAINDELESLPESIQVMAEPGRYFVGSAGCLVSQVVGVATRDQSRWLYLDTGFYGGLMELEQGFALTLVSQRTGAAELWSLAGPTCDSIDVLGKHYLPATMQAEDLVFIPNMGAYSASCACDFNGFPVPKMLLVS